MGWDIEIFNRIADGFTQSSYDEFTHFDYDRQDLVEINIGSNSSCPNDPLDKISLLRSSRINHPFIPSLSRGLRGGQDQIFKSHGIWGKLVLHAVFIRRNYIVI